MSSRDYIAGTKIPDSRSHVRWGRVTYRLKRRNEKGKKERKKIGEKSKENGISRKETETGEENKASPKKHRDFHIFLLE
jgi:hypothetical protein